jgi:hypothetical protein
MKPLFSGHLMAGFPSNGSSVTFWMSGNYLASW